MPTLKEMIVGRREEKRVLKRIFDAKRAEFLAIFGRRRIGKTYLIKRFYAEKSCYYFQVTGIKDGTLREQIHEFTKAVEETFYQAGTSLKEPATWMQSVAIC